MICSMFRNMMDLYAEGRLAGFQARWMERHAAACPGCAAELAAWKRLFTKLRGIPTPQPPAGLKGMLLAALAGREAEAPEPAEDDAAIVLHGRAWEPSMALAAGLLALTLSSSISALGPGVPSQGYPDAGIANNSRG